MEKIITGTDFETLEDAIAADIVSSIPVLGAFSDFMRAIESGEKPQRILQTLDLMASPFPIINIVTPTNSMIYLDKKGILPIELSKIENILPKKSRRKV